MSSTPKRLAVFYTVPIAWIFTAFVTLFVALMGLGTLMSGSANRSLFAICFGLVMMASGLAATVLNVWLAWTFYMFNPTAFQFTKAMRWTPQFWLATGFGKWLDDEQVLDAFGNSQTASK